MSSPATADRYGYCGEEPVHSEAAPAPAHLEDQERAILPGEQPAEHNMRTTRGFYPVGSRVGVFGNIGAGCCRPVGPH